MKFYVAMAVMVGLIATGCRNQTISHDLVVGCWKADNLRVVIDKAGLMKVGNATLQTQGILDNNHHYSIASEPFRIDGSRVIPGQPGFQDAWIELRGNARRVITIRLIGTDANASPFLRRC